MTREQGVLSPDYDPTAADVLHTATEFGIPVLRPPFITHAAPLLHELNAEYFFVANYQLILPRHIHLLPRRFSVNFHTGPLPRYAGLMPWHWMWKNRETEGGVVAIRLGDIVDCGEIIDEWPIQIEPAWTEEHIRDQHFQAAYLLLSRLLDNLPSLSINDFRPQDLRFRTYYDRSGLVERKSGIFAQSPPPKIFEVLRDS